VRILAFEPYDGGSHRAVRESITRHSRHEWTWLTRPPRAWKWRMRLAALELAGAARATGALDPSVDAIFATSLLSLADLVACLREQGGPADVPTVLYMHENQAAYPAGPAAPVGERDVHFALTNLTSIHAADLTIWNSDWNRRSFRAGIGEILRHAPDATADLATGLDERLADSVVIWPPVEPPPAPGEDDGRVLHNPPRVVWPHRWEHDKGPEELLAVAEAHRDLGLRWTILGQEFRETPPALEAFRRRFGDHIDHVGFAPDRAAYWRHLAGCDWVLSTARHEFFGIAVVEALLAGCLPWLPDALSYPELTPAAARGLSPRRPPDDPAAVRRAVRSHLAPAVAGTAVERMDEVLERVGDDHSGQRC
jgi:glycosyltransferase involved in cell wall biosynthesis